MVKTSQMEERFDALLQHGWRSGASDLYLSAGQCAWLRQDGRMRAYEALVPDDDALQRFLACMLQERDWQHFLAAKSLDFAWQEGRQRLRGNVFYQQGHLSLVLRFLPVRVPSLSELHMEAIGARILTAEDGLILVCGPTGAGKTTTLAACLDAINHQRAAHILTLEDPIEYIFSPDCCLINQRELGRDFLSFSDALRSALRQMPDVLLVGELRDRETVETALMAAESGMLVFGTLHTRRAAEVPARIESFFPPEQRESIREQLGRVFRAALAQRLLPACHGGRVAAVEVLLRETSVCSLIRQGKYEQLLAAMMRHGELGMQTMEKAREKLCRQGYISAQEMRQQ